MKTNRFLGGISIAFHSAAELLSAAVIIRLLIEFIYLRIPPDMSDILCDGGFGDKFTPLLLLAAGLLCCVRYNKLCASVNLSPFKRFSAIFLLGLVPAAAFAFWDIFMAKVIYSALVPYEIIYPYRYVLLWTEGVASSEDYLVNMFSSEGAYFFVKLMLFYHIAFLLGYSTAHILSGEKKSNRRFYFVYFGILVALILNVFITADINETAENIAFCLLMLWFAATPAGVAVLFLTAFAMSNHPSELTILMALIYAANVGYTALFSMLVKPKIKRLRPKR